MCNLFISCKHEDDDEEEQEDKCEVLLENRVFVCIGLQKDDHEITGWVMVINKNLSDVTFWDPIHHKEWDLKGRIAADNKEHLKEYLAQD